MTATFLLVRHAEHDLLGRVLAGRMPGVGLGAAGREQAAALARRLGGQEIAAVQASPQARAGETAAPLAAELGLAVETVPALDEIDFGAWQGRSFAELEGDAAWRDWNARRGAACPPGGESMQAAQARIVAHMQAMRQAWPDRRLVLVSHGDVIRAALLHVLGAPLDCVHRLDIDPASVSTIVLGDWGGKVLAMNERCPP